MYFRAARVSSKAKSCHSPARSSPEASKMHSTFEGGMMLRSAPLNPCKPVTAAKHINSNFSFVSSHAIHHVHAIKLFPALADQVQGYSQLVEDTP